MTNNEIKANIQRLQKTIENNFWNKGYIENCKNNIKTYQDMLKK